MTKIEDYLIYKYNENKNGKKEIFDKNGKSNKNEYEDTNRENSDKNEKNIKESENFQECVVIIESS